MKAMILAAGRGERLRPLTDHTPKPLIKVNGIPLIEHHIVKLAAAGITEIVINLAWLGEQIEQYLQDGSRWNVSLQYSWERPHALETAGGIIKALPLLTDPQDVSAAHDTFLVINGDIYCDYDFSSIPDLAENDLAHLWLVPNPEHHPEGDFQLLAHRVSTLSSQEQATSDNVSYKPSYTFSGVGLYKAALFYQLAQNKIDETENTVLKLGPSLKVYASKGLIQGELLTSFWTDVGTLERLQQVNRYLGANR